MHVLSKTHGIEGKAFTFLNFYFCKLNNKTIVHTYSHTPVHTQIEIFFASVLSLILCSLPFDFIFSFCTFVSHLCHIILLYMAEGKGAEIIMCFQISCIVFACVCWTLKRQVEHYCCHLNLPVTLNLISFYFHTIFYCWVSYKFFCTCLPACSVIVNTFFLP